MDDLTTPGERLYEQSRLLAPSFAAWLKPWDELTREEREEWEVMAFEQAQSDRLTSTGSGDPA